MLTLPRLFLLAAWLVLGVALVAAQNQPPAPASTFSQQELSIQQQMQAITSAGAQQQSQSINAQAESLRKQYGTSTGTWADSSNAAPAAPPIKDISDKPQSKPIEEPKPIAIDHSAETEVQIRGFYTTPWPSSPDFVMPNVQVATTACDALSSTEVNTLVKDASAKNNVDPTLLRAVMVQESGFRPCAVSTAGAMGLMQVMPDTAEDLGLADPFDPSSNVNAGAKYLKQMLDRYHGNKALALAAYNAGPGRTDRANGAVPEIPETIGYVASILSNIPLF